MPVPAPKRWLVERAFVDPAVVDLPDGDLNLDTLRPWFAAKRFVELTAAVLDRPGRGLVAAVPSVTVAADELTLQQKFQQGVGTNLALDNCSWTPTVAEGVRLRIEAARPRLRHRGVRPARRCSGTGSTTSCYLLEINSLCGLTEATVFYSQWLADADSLPPWAVLDRIVEAGFERFARMQAPGTGGPGRLMQRVRHGDDPARRSRRRPIPAWRCWARPTPAGTPASASTHGWSRPATSSWPCAPSGATGTTSSPTPSPAGRPGRPGRRPGGGARRLPGPGGGGHRVRHGALRRPRGPRLGVPGSWRSPAPSARPAPRSWWPTSSPPGSRVFRTPGNYSGRFGLAVALGGLRPEHEVAVVEMATGHFGEIDAMCAMAPPEVGVVTAVDAAHLVALGDVDGVAREKGALLAHLPRRRSGRARGGRPPGARRSPTAAPLRW